ncbi:uncharacterized protein K489DRAFT_380428 [Dissoconium aciculare CBS 342.82]|uniref:Uncharacterized protein n=1 Tax=Dissoconium aciculare CBS 342.82 TaxID=1314786 RepID=A0A6J3M858_9PEZI|nr:uncharacterized protein K489DRAFT_380428 [Dissoconium aciculare CBS 342.82]KAF1823032.1 hypothetical protein K489DRAFT_380428 [Dissoconium aciculare CBS 342.82]
MTELKGGKFQPAADPSINKGQALSRPASDASHTGTLRDDLPPAYDDLQPGGNPSGPSFGGPAVVQAANSSPATQADPSARQKLHPSEVGPTTDQPFHFPTNAVPAYNALDPVRRPLAIPQLQPKETSPFLEAYPVCLLSFGIPEESWLSFVDTLSAFLNAAVGTQAVQHAVDLAYTLGEAHKDWALSQKDAAMDLGRKAQRGDLIGVIGGTLGLTLGTAGHIVDSVLKFPGRLVKRPQSPRDRADAYVATANKDWLNARGLHARIVDTEQLAEVADATLDDFVKSARKAKSVGEQFSGLSTWIAEMHIGEAKDIRAKGDKAKLPMAAAPALDITKKTLWLTMLKLDEEEMAMAQQGVPL